MSFKNKLEEAAYNIAINVFKKNVTIEHDKVVRIEKAIFPEIASFSGPPKKEIDILTIGISNDPNISLLISCKDFSSSKAEPSHVQEWCSVIQTMNKYSINTKYLGMVLCPSGFTKGCEPWATSSNIALIPPIKGMDITIPSPLISINFTYYRYFFKYLLN